MVQESKLAGDLDWCQAGELHVSDEMALKEGLWELQLRKLPAELGCPLHRTDGDLLHLLLEMALQVASSGGMNKRDLVDQPGDVSMVWMSIVGASEAHL